LTKIQKNVENESERCFRLLISRSVPEIFAIKLLSYPKLRRILDVFALSNLWCVAAVAPKNVYPTYHAHPTARHVEQLCGVTPLSPKKLFNRSLAAGRFPLAFKEAFVTPVIKKSGLDAAQVSSYRPISNLSVMSKLLERLVAKQLTDYLRSADLLPSLQS